MAYILKADVKEYIGKTDTDDDDFIDELITYAQAELEHRTQKVFEGNTGTERNYRIPHSATQIFFETWAHTITTVTNGDDDETALVDGTDFVTMPENEGPFYGIEILTDSENVFQGKVVVSAKFAYINTPPLDIKHVMIRWVSYLLQTRKEPRDILPDWVEEVIERWDFSIFPGASY